MLLAAAIAANLTVLLVFKYGGLHDCERQHASERDRRPPLAAPHLVLPIGISFFTFHAISYVVDVYRRDASAQKRPVEAALYLLVFPQLIAGPIVRYRQIAAQLHARADDTSDFAYGVRRFIIGLSRRC